MDGQAMVTEARLGSIGTRRKKAPPEPRAPQVFLTVLRRHDLAVSVRILLGRVTFAVAPNTALYGWVVPLRRSWLAWPVLGFPFAPMVYLPSNLDFYAWRHFDPSASMRARH